MYAVVDERGEVTLPRPILEAAMAEPGDLVECWVTGPQELALKVIFRIPMSDYDERAFAAAMERSATEPAVDSLMAGRAIIASGERRRGESIDELPEQQLAADDELVDYDALPILTAEEIFERFRIDGPVNWSADREAIHAEMAEDVFGERPERRSG